MAKTKISEYSSTAGSNTDINNINLAEGMAPSLVNNAIRQLMAQLKDFQAGTAGDSLTVGGNLSVTGTSTLTGAITATAGITGPVTTSSAAISGGTINGAVIGGVTPQAITGTTVTANTGFVGALTGNVTGNVTGNTAGTHTGAVTGNVTGDLTGNVTASSGTSTFNNVTINGTLDMASGTAGTITGLATPTNSSDAATKGYVDAVDAAKLNLSGGTMSGNIAMGGNKVTGLGTPTGDADAVTKAYVDAIAQGIDAKASCRVATTANITLSGTQTIDGVSVIAGDRVLVKDQTTTSANGIYVAAAGSWTRATDADAWTELVSAYAFVESGTANSGNGYLCTVAAGGTLGTTAVTFTQFSGAGQITAGAGLTKTGNQLDVGTASSSRIVVNADNIDLATTGVSASTYKSVTVDTYGRVTGGTNPTTISGFGITDAYTKTEIDTTTSALLPKSGGTMTGNIVMGSNKVTSTATPTTDDDLTRKAYVDGILGSATSAAASAAAAATSATNAATSATNASTSAGQAATSATAAEAAYDSFDDRYLGAKSSAPTVDNDGNALLTGAIYWNSTSSTLWVWNGSAWTQATLTAGSFATLAGTETLTNKTVVDPKNAFQAIASGSLSDGSKVIINADGTVSAVASSLVAGSNVTFRSAYTSNIAATYDSVNQKVVVAYTDGGNSYYGTAVVGTVSGTSISFGTAVVFESANTTAISAAYDSVNQKVVIAYTDVGNSSYGTAIVGTVSGTSISFGTAVVFENASTSYSSSAYDSVNQKVVISFRDVGNSNYGTAVVGTVSGTSISFGTAAVFESASTSYIYSTYDSVSQKAVVTYRNSLGYGSAIVGTVSGTSISFGTAVVFNSASTIYPSCVYDSVNQKVAVSFIDSGNSSYGTTIVGTVSGTSISFGTGVVFRASSVGYITSSYDTSTGKVVVFYGADFSNAYAIVGTVSGTSISFGTDVLVSSTYGVGGAFSSAYDSVNQKVIFNYQRGNGYGLSVVTASASSNLTSENYVGISSASYTNGQTATIQIVGSVDDAQSGLTPGQAYYVQTDGSLGLSPSTPSVFAGTAISSTKIIVKG